ncbi:MAG TPA: class I SAM-dependent methyltransferase [Burkholderiaceae bacterium]|jgi:hypothetical protein|nr:class I SAM-dependent methyltransferase [Burkholderiaceae bacterium]
MPDPVPSDSAGAASTGSPSTGSGSSPSTASSALTTRLLRWPLPALLSWTAAWGVFFAMRAADWAPLWALSAATLFGLLLAVFGGTPWRRVFIGAGFPLSAMLLVFSLGSGSLSPWTWLVPLALLALLYPINTWRDAPLFPTPLNALDGLAAAVPITGQPRILDAGCGLGAGLRALRDQYPTARLTGLEWSWPLALACRWRCRFAQVRRASMWSTAWAGQDMVYLFQRPESMPRAGQKALAELAPGAWLVSLEFPVPGFEPQARLETVPGKPVWVYRMPPLADRP